MRDQSGLSQRELAERAGTSQPAIAAYEANRKSPTLRTLQRLAAATGCDLAVELIPPLTREDRRSLALHTAIARRLAADPDDVLRLARRNLARMRESQAGGHQLLREWDVLLDRPLPALLRVLTDTDPWARELRQVTPFAGVLTAAERAEVYARFRGEEAS